MGGEEPGPEVWGTTDSPEWGSAPPGAGQGKGSECPSDRPGDTHRERTDTRPGAVVQVLLIGLAKFYLSVRKPQLCWSPTRKVCARVGAPACAGGLALQGTRSGWGRGAAPESAGSA